MKESDAEFRISICALLLLGVLIGLPSQAKSQTDSVRKVRYHPDTGDFVITNGTKRFNRALYGSHTGFRVEAGDRPQFAMYMPGIGGTLKLGVIAGNQSKWLSDFSHIEARYHPGMMIYDLRDSLIGNGAIRMDLLAMSDADGMILKVTTSGQINPCQLIWAFGGASGQTPSRSGDLGADPRSIFFLTPEHAQGNSFSVGGNNFNLHFSIDGEQVQLQGVTPRGSEMKVSGATCQKSPDIFWNSEENQAPVLAGKKSLAGDDSLYIAIRRADNQKEASLSYDQLSNVFKRSLQYRDKIAGKVQIETPDPWLNTLGATISVAGDAIWDPPTYIHGAVAWRSRLQGWRGAYAGDDLGWHDRAKSHFQAFNGAQVLQPDSTIVYPDTSMNLSRQKEEIGFGPFNRGYIARQLEPPFHAHHYDMNQVYIDQLMRHFLWTGDIDFLKKSWPVIKRHLAWEKRNFDYDNNGLYDAYASIWASDALEYSGGDVAYSSAYNYFENKMAARFALLLGKDPKPYQQEAKRILQAMDSLLWLPGKGWYGEYRDRLGLQKVHPSAGLWSVYHSIDKQISDPFQTYQLLRYVDIKIPHIPVRAGEFDDSYYTLSTTDWKPYTWSVNNVAFAEVAHTALAYWEGGRKNEAYKLFKSNILDNMYMGSSPGNFAQLSYYDHFRGELYRDFADPIGISSRALIEGLFGIRPDALADTLHIQPGFPSSWNYASLRHPDVSFKFRRQGNVDHYDIKPTFPKSMNLSFETEARSAGIEKVTVNGNPIQWHSITTAVGNPQVTFSADEADSYDIKIKWNKKKPVKPQYKTIAAVNRSLSVTIPAGSIEKLNDPQHVLASSHLNRKKLTGIIADNLGQHTFFVQIKQGSLQWWQPVNIAVRPAYQIVANKRQSEDRLEFAVRNNTGDQLNREVRIIINQDTLHRVFKIPAYSSSDSVWVDSKNLVSGTNNIRMMLNNGDAINQPITNWQIDQVASGKSVQWQTVDLYDYFNDRVTQIFKNKYWSPRPHAPTLQLPLQGIGDWTHTDLQPDIDDSGLRKKAGEDEIFRLPNGISFKTPGSGVSPNIIFTSRWDNYPDQISVPLQGKARHAYLLMAGSTNFMQSRLENGEVIVHYQDGSTQKLKLRNPTTWWPIERDYYTDEYAFRDSVPTPFRVHLKTGTVTRHIENHDVIDGGAATVLDMPLNPRKELSSFELKTTANDVVIGLMSLTLLK